MQEEFIIIQKFTDVDNAEEFASELKKNNIEYLIQNSNKSSVGNFEINTLDFDVAVNIKSSDFSRAEKVLEDYYKNQISNIESSYYLLEFTNNELHEIIANPFEWGRFDYQLAKKILKDRGEEVSDAKVQIIKEDKISKLSEFEKVSREKIIIGYILSIIFPIVGMLIGYNIMNNKKLLPTGQILNSHSQHDRIHGKRIFWISIAWIFVLVMIKVIFSLTNDESYF